MSDLPSDTRTYNRYCALSRALDVVGERWTFLIVLELLSGPKRFTDLEEGLGGIARNLLSSRLKHLRACGLVEKTQLDPPARATVYQLTQKGEDLEPVIRHLQRWGLDFLGRPDEDQKLRPQWILQGLIALVDDDDIRGISATYEFHLDDTTFHLQLDDGTIRGREAPFDGADLTIRGSARAFVEAMLSREDPEQLLEKRDLTFDGDPDLFVTLRELYDMPGGPNNTD